MRNRGRTDYANIIKNGLDSPVVYDGVCYEEYLASDKWRDKATAAKERAGWRCQLCNSKHRLEVHHRTYERVGREEDTDLTVLCYYCHEMYEANKGKFREEIVLP